MSFYNINIETIGKYKNLKKKLKRISNKKTSHPLAARLAALPARSTATRPVAAHAGPHRCCGRCGHDQPSRHQGTAPAPRTWGRQIF